MFKICVFYYIEIKLQNKYFWKKSMSSESNLTGNSENDVNTGYILKLQLMGSVDELDVGCEKKGRQRDASKIS